MSKEKAQWEVTLKNILYYVDENEQDKVLEILKKYEEKIPDNRIKNFLQKKILNSKKDYYSKVDYLVDDILEGKLDDNTKKVLNELLNELQPPIKKAEENFWQRLLKIFGVS